MLAMLGDNSEHVMSYWVMYEAFDSPVLGGFAVIAHWTPFLLLSVTIGALVDRFDCRRIIQVAQVTFMVVSLTWGILFLTGTFQVWHAVVLLILHGLSGSLWSPASQLIIHDIVGDTHLQSGVRLNATARQLGILMGPALGGLLMLVVGPARGLMLNALIYLPLTIWLLRVPYTGHVRALEGRPVRLSLRQTAGVLREVARNRAILSMVALAGITSLLVGNAYEAQMPALAADFGGDEIALDYTRLLAANAAGAVIGGLLLESAGLLRASARTAIVCAALWCVAIGGFAAARSYPVALLLMFVAGVFQLAFGAMAQTIVQLEAPANQRGRAIGLFNMAQLGLRLGAGVSVGMLGGLIGVRWSLGLSASVLLMIVLGLLAYFTAAQSRKPAVREW
jgi:MFS family permease